MNAPVSAFKAADADDRGTFSGFVVDAATVETVRQVATELGWPPERVEQGGLSRAIEMLGVGDAPDFLLIDLSESIDPILDINRLAEVCEPGTIVIAVGETNDVQLYRDLIASGLQDYLVKPITTEMMREAILTAEMALAQAEQEDPSQTAPTRAIGVVGIRGGVGASTIATSMAWVTAQTFNKKTALLDLDIHFGTGALTFDMEPGRGLCDALDNPGRIDSLFIERAMIKADKNLSVLGAEAPVNDLFIANQEALSHLEDELIDGFEAVFLDLPRMMATQFPFVISKLTDVVLVSDLTLAATRDCIRMMTLVKQAAPQAKLHIVLNKVPVAAMQEISVKDFETSIEHKADFTIANDCKSFVEAAKRAKPLVQLTPNAKPSIALTDMTGVVIGEKKPKKANPFADLLGKLKKPENEEKAPKAEKAKKANKPDKGGV